MQLLDNQYLVFHYSSVKFDDFDNSKSDGFWFTSIAPHESEMISEIGASGAKFCAKCVITIENKLTEGRNYDIADLINEEECDGLIYKYDGFTDYAVVDNSKIQILEWIKMI